MKILNSRLTNNTIVRLGYTTMSDYYLITLKAKELLIPKGMYIRCERWNNQLMIAHRQKKLKAMISTDLLVP